MPPAFNLSQDQTLQFDLVCLGSVFLPKFPRLVLPRAFRLFPSVRLSQHCPRLAPAQGSALAFERPRLSAVFCKRSLLLPRSPPATISQARYFSTAFLRKPANLPLFFPASPLLVPFLALDHAPAPVAPSFWPGAVTVAWLAQVGEDRPAHPKNSAAMRRHRRLQGIDEQARNVAPRLFLYLLKAGRAGDIDSGPAVADHIPPRQQQTSPLQHRAQRGCDFPVPC